MPKVTSSQQGRLNERFAISALLCLSFWDTFYSGPKTIEPQPRNRERANVITTRSNAIDYVDFAEHARKYRGLTEETESIHANCG